MRIEETHVKLPPLSSPISLTPPGEARAAALRSRRIGESGGVPRERVSEIVGSVFYGHLLREMQKTTFETPLMHGGRGEEVFRGQWIEEIGRRIARAPGNPITDRLHRAMQRIEPSRSAGLAAVLEGAA